MTEQQVVEAFLKNPCYLKNGAGFLSRKWGVDKEVVKTARIKVRGVIRSDQGAIANNYIATLEEEVTRIIEQETNHTTGDQKITIESTKPLSPKELEELVGIDNISTFIDRSWLKSHKNGTWTYSILTVNKIKDFYIAEELTEKLKEIFKNESPLYFPVPEESTSGKALYIYIGDDHCGLILQESLFQKEYSGKTYAQRLLQVVEEIKSLDQFFSKICVVRGGDELDGYNNKTTRQDHELSAGSNKEQFDIYTIANKLFYDDLFSSGSAERYEIINLNNSNHSGNGFSYIANKALEFWLEAKFPDVTVTHQHKFIESYTFGNHVISLTHGKDEKYMKSPMPLNLDYKTDLWLMEYHKKVILSGSWISTVKFDMHKHNVNQGKSGRYVGVPSISSGSNYIEHNYGESTPGCLLEIYSATSPNITSIPIWFN